LISYTLPAVLIARPAAIATAGENPHIVLQQDGPADKVCGLVKLCPKDIVI